MPLILPGNVATATASTTYDVANSCRFDRGSSASMHITFSSAGDRQKFTFSFWIKRNKLGTQEVIFDTNFGGGASEHRILFDSSDRLEYYDYASSSTTLKYVTNRVFRDISAWYHIVIAVDTTQGTAGNRVKIYINGTQETSFGTETQPSENLSTSLNTAVKHQIGTKNVGANYLDAYLAEFVFIDGTQYANTDFGEFDSDSPRIWKPKDPSGLTFGTNGFYLDFEASDNLGNDANGGTDLTEVNLAATDQSTDTCTNNFCTFNPLIPNTSITYSEGNLQVVSTSGGDYKAAVGTIGTQSGKWYCEMKASDGFNGSDKGCGIYRLDNAYGATTGLGNYTSGTTWSYAANGNVRTNNGTSDTETTFTDGDIIGIAMDLDNNKLYFAKNNTWINSGDPTSGSTGTGAYAIVSGDFYTFAATVIDDGSEDPVWQGNFGSPAYSVSSPQSDANGFGSFSYAPPSGYLSLCSKNLGSDGG